MKLRVSPVLAADLKDVAAFIMRHSPSALTVAAYLRHLEWMLIENPAASPLIPLGYVLRDEGHEIHGTQMLFPQKFQCASVNITALVSNGSFASDSARRMGSWALIFNEYRKLSSRHPLLATTANENSAPFFRRLGGKSILGWDAEMVIPLNKRRILADLLYKRMPQLTAQSSSHVGEVKLHSLFKKVSHVESAANLKELLLLKADISDRIFSCKDVDYLDWRFFKKPTNRPMVLRLDGKDGVTPMVVAVALERRGARRQLHLLRVLDAFNHNGAVAFRTALSHLRLACSNRVDGIVWQNFADPSPHFYKDGGIRCRLKTNRAWVLDPKLHTRAKNWILSYSDGDAAF